MKKALSFTLAVLMLLSTFAFPIVAADTVAATEIVNLYNFYRSNGDLVAEDGTVTESTDISSNSLIAVEAGQTLYFGPCAADEVYLATYTSDGSFIARVAAGDCTAVSTLEDGSIIYSYTLPENAASVWCAAGNSYAIEFVLTSGQPFDATVLAEYLAINPLTGKKALFLGDSIAYGSSNGGKAWAETIAANNSMTYVKPAQSGWSLSTARAGQYGMIIDQLTSNKDGDFDYIVLHGGANDAWSNVKVGTVSEGYDPSKFDLSTFAGGLEDLIYNALYYFGDTAAIGYLANYAMPSHSSTNDWGNYEVVAEQICDKWGIAYFDMYDNAKVTADLAPTTTTYLHDYCHPNAAGYAILSPMIEGFMKTLTVKEEPATPTDGVKVTFLDRNGEPLAVRGVNANGNVEDYVIVEPIHRDDAVVDYGFAGWTLDGEIIDAYSYTFTEDATLTATYAGKYGARFEDIAPIELATGTVSTAGQQLLPETVKLHPTSRGFTVIYKVEGADTEIIADNLVVGTNGQFHSGQWGNTGYTSDGNPNSYFELNNGYYYMYINQNINGTHGALRQTLSKFAIFHPDDTNGTRYVTDRTPANTNENATFQMLAVVVDNLQPTVTFHNEDGSVITTYQHKYTDIHTHLNFGVKPQSLQEGALLTPTAMLNLAQAADSSIIIPEKDGMIIKGWKDADGNIVEGIYYNADLYPVFGEPSEEDIVTATFLDRDGKTVATVETYKGYLLPEAPEGPVAESDGILTYSFAGWKLGSNLYTDLSTYVLMRDVTFTASYNTYGANFDDLDPIALNKPGEDGTIAQQDLLPEQVKMDPASVGMTFVYKIEGADTQVIADNRITYTNGRKLSSGQWNKPEVTPDGNAINYLEFNNGYYFIYLNQNVNGYWATTPNTLDNFLVFCPDYAGRYTTTRTPTNDNENATFQMLAVVNDNLQPTVTFHNEDGSVLTTYQHKYTDVNKNLGLNLPAGSYTEGQILTPNAIFLLAQQADTTLATPEKENMFLSGWADAEGNVVDGVYKNIDVYPVFREATDEDKVTATFVDKEGNVVATMKAFPGYLLPEEAPAVPEAKADGLVTYTPSGWAVNGSIVDTANYVLTEDVTFTATYSTYGARFDHLDPIPINKPGEDGTIAQQDLLPSQVKMDPASVGMTFVYKIEGATEQIIADNWITYVNGRKYSSGQWNKPEVTPDGNGIHYLEFDNGYYFIYLNQNVNGYWAATPSTLDTFLIFSPDVDNRYTTDRTPTNNNENATFQMLAVVNDNLQPTITFHGADGSVLTTYQHKYTDVTKNLGLGLPAGSYTEGKLLSPTAIFTLAQASDTTLVMPEQEGMILDGWVDADGNKVDAVYYNVELYPTFREPTEEDVCTVTFEDKDGNVVATMQNYVGYTIPEAAPAIPEVESDGIIEYVAKGWALNGTVTDPATVTLDGDITFTATYTVYGARFEDTEAIAIGDGSAAQELLPETVKLNPASHGITVVYKVDGVTEEIIADNFVLGTNGQEYSAQWGNEGYAKDGDHLCYLEFNNGYYYMYLNQNINGTHGKTPDILNKFSIFNANDTVNNKYVTDRTPVNNNEGATFQMLAVLSDNLQPVVTFHDAQGEAFYVCQYNYTGIYAHIGFAETFTPLSNSCIEGRLLTGDEIFAQALTSASDVAIPEKGLGYEFDGWVDAAGNKVDAVYYNIDLYPTYRQVSYYDVTFVGDDGTVLYETAANEGDYAEYVGDEPVKAYDGEYVYTFAGWAIADDVIVDPATTPITAETTFYAVYTKTAHVHNLVVTGAGTAKCVDEICGKEFNNAFTVIADPNVELSALKAGETVIVPVIVNNGAFVGVNLKIVTSDNVTVTDIDVTGTPFEGYTAEFANSIVLNAATGNADITSDCTIVYLTLTANADIAEGDTVTVQVIAEQIVNIADEDITADVADGYVATYTAVAAEEEILWGDVNGDNELTPADIMLLTRYVNKWNPNTYTDIKNPDWGDVNGDNELTPADIMLLTRFINKWNPNTYVDAKNLVGSN